MSLLTLGAPDTNAAAIVTTSIITMIAERTKDRSIRLVIRAVSHSQTDRQQECLVENNSFLYSRLMITFRALKLSEVMRTWIRGKAVNRM